MTRITINILRRLVFLWGLAWYGLGLVSLRISLVGTLLTPDAILAGHLLASTLQCLAGGLLFNFGLIKMPVPPKLEVQMQDDGSVRVFIPKKIPDVGEFRSKLSAGLERAGFRVWISWPKRVPMNRDFADALHSLGNVIDGTDGFLWISGVRPKDRKMIADHRGPKVEWVD